MRNVYCSTLRQTFMPKDKRKFRVKMASTVLDRRKQFDPGPGKQHGVAEVEKLESAPKGEQFNRRKDKDQP